MISGLSDAGRGHAAMLLFSSLIAGSFAIGSQAAQFIEPSVLNAARFLLAACVVGGMALALGKLSRSAARAPWRYLILGGLFAIYFVTMFEALKTVSPVSTSAVFTLTPFIAAIFGWFWLGQRMSTRMAAALGIGAIGAIWVIFKADLGALLRFDVGKGETIFLVGCVAHAIYPTVSRALNRGEPALAVNFGMLIAGLIVLVVYGWGDIWATDWTVLPPIVWITIVYTAIISGAATFTLLQYASQRLPAGKVMAYTYLVPGWVVCWQLALGKETPPPAVFAGVGLIVAALLLLLKEDG